MQNKLALALGSFSKYLAVQLFFFTYVLSIFIQAKAPSQKIYLTGMFFYLLPLTKQSETRGKTEIKIYLVLL